MDKKLPLAGVKVVELTRVIVGPCAGRFLGTYGATVVHIESQRRLDFLRTIFPYKDNISGINRAAYFNVYNADKYGIALDLTTPEGLEIMKKLIIWADIYIESNVPGMIDKYKLDYDNVRKLKPDIIMLSTNQMGREGPSARYKGFGVQTAAMAGFHEITGYPDSGPMGPFGAYTDMVSHQWLIAALVAALDYRRRTGKGQYIDHSQLEAGIHFLAPAILNYTVNKQPMSRVGNREELAAPHGCYRCRGEDRWCTIAVYSDDEWDAFCQALGEPSWTKGEKFATLSGRKENEDDLDGLVGEWTQKYTPEEVMSRLQAVNVAAGIVATGEDLNNDPQLADREHYTMLRHSEIGEVPFSNPPFKLSKTPGEVRMPSPCFGEHTEYVCREILGITDKEFIDLLQKGVFE
ncbi:CaiB/BaiF CoA transferase family protein [Chloroflexota bacterium]